MPLSTDTPDARLAAVRPLVERWARFWDVDPNLVLAVCWVESSFRAGISNHHAVSLGGAWGLMQVTTVTGKDLVGRASANARHLGTFATLSPTLALWKGQGPDLLAPELNVCLGAFYLHLLVGEFHEPEKAAAAYNAGPGTVRQAMRDPDAGSWWAKLRGDVRDYVSKVLRAHATFAAGHTPWTPGKPPAPPSSPPPAPPPVG